MSEPDHDRIIEALAEEHGLEPEQFILPIQFINPARRIARVTITPRQEATVRIEIVQNGRVLRQHNYEGRSYIEAPPEGEYTIRLTNTQRSSRFSNETGRQLAVLSVDGLNIITGEKAAFDGPGYVVLPGQTINIPGWRRSDSEVAAFEFKPQESSYTAQVGNGTSNTGVIGLAVFNEQKPIQSYDSDLTTTPLRRVTTTTTTTVETEIGETLNERINRRAQEKGFGPDGRGTLGIPISARSSGDYDDGVEMTLCSESGPAAGASAAAAASTYSADTISSRYFGEPMGREVLRRRFVEELGTGYGGRRTMYTEETTFQRASEVPAQVITLQYAVRAKLIEWGVPLPELPPSPSAFPASQGPSVAAPPGWRG